MTSIPDHLKAKMAHFGSENPNSRLYRHYQLLKDGVLVSDMNVYECEGEIQRTVQMRSGEGAKGPWQVSNLRVLINHDGKRLYMSGVAWGDVAAQADGLTDGTRVKLRGPLVLGREWTNREGVVQPAVPELNVTSLEVLGERSHANEPKRVDVEVHPQQGRITFG